MLIHGPRYLRCAVLVRVSIDVDTTSTATLLKESILLGLV